MPCEPRHLPTWPPVRRCLWHHGAERERSPALPRLDSGALAENPWLTTVEALRACLGNDRLPGPWRLPQLGLALASRHFRVLGRAWGWGLGSNEPVAAAAGELGSCLVQLVERANH
jgi:hypothetical protein